MAALVNSVNFMANAPSPFTQTITDANAPAGALPKAIVWILSGHKDSVAALGTPQARARISVGFTDLTDEMAVAGGGENAADGDTEWRSDNARSITLSSTVGGGALEVDAFVSAVSAGSVELTWSSSSDFWGVALFIYGSQVEATVEVLTSSSSIGGTVSSTALGRTPDLLIAASCGQTIGSGAGGTEYMMSVGYMARHSSSQVCTTACAENRQVNTSAGSIIRNDAILTQLTSAAGTVSEGTRLEASLDASGFTITTRNSAAAMDGIYLALYLGVARCWVGVEDVAAGSTGLKSITSPGWEPRTVGALAIRVTTGNVNTVSSAQGSLSIGFATALEQGVCGTFFRDNVATAETSSVFTEALIDLPANTSTHDWQATLDAMTATGFDIDVTDATGANRLVAFLAIEEPPEIIISETENITDSVAMGVGLAQSETENLTDEHAFMVGLAQSETENISDDVVLVAVSVATDVFLVVAETVSIDDADELYLGQLLALSDTESITEEGPVFTASMSLDDTVNLLESQNFNGQALIVLSDSVELSDSGLVYLGYLLALSDTENITDEHSFGRGLIATHGTPRGTTLQGGAETGAVLGPHSERGTTLG